MTLYSKPALDFAVRKAVVAERERCARIAENIGADVWKEGLSIGQAIAHKIRETDESR